MKILNIARYESFTELYDKYEPKKGSSEMKNLILLFIAGDDLETKESWCSDCRKSKPIIESVIEKFQFNEEIILAIIQVGQKEEWKKSDNPFRTHKLQIQAVPTLLSLKNVSKSS